MITTNNLGNFPL